MTIKYCSKCKTTLPTNLFQKRSASKDGLHHWCSLCYNSYRRERGYNKKYRPIDYNKVRQGWKSHRKTVKGRASFLLRTAKKRAEFMDLEFDLDLDWVIERLEPMICEATGVPLTFDVPDNQRSGGFSPSLDKKDPHKGYTKDNCHVVCWMYNRGKGQDSHEDVIRMATSLLLKEKVSFVSH